MKKGRNYKRMRVQRKEELTKRNKYEAKEGKGEKRNELRKEVKKIERRE